MRLSAGALGHETMKLITTRIAKTIRPDREIATNQEVAERLDHRARRARTGVWPSSSTTRVEAFTFSDKAAAGSSAG
jgi:hypothetical protein